MVVNVLLDLNTASVTDLSAEVQEVNPPQFTAFPLELFSFAQAKVP